MKHIPDNILISRTDSIGDVILTLPIATVLKKNFPGMKIGFMGKNYTRPVIEACKSIDGFVDVADFMKDDLATKPGAIIHVLPNVAIAKKAQQMRIPERIGTSNRFYHWFTCNELVKLSRKHSDLHEAQLNLKLLSPFNINAALTLEEISSLFALEDLQPLPNKFAGLTDKKKYNVILHPKSQGSGREWGITNFIELIHLLNENDFKIFISGVEKERSSLQPIFDEVGDKVTDIAGLMSLSEFMSFIASCDGLVAAGTGPIHLAAALGKDALGIYPPMRPIHPGRWASIGFKSKAFVVDRDCSDCRKNANACHCIQEISPSQIWAELQARSRMQPAT